MARPAEDATEEPTPRRLAEARRRGDVAVSRELSSAAALLAAIVVLSVDAPAALARAVAALRAGLTAAVAGGPPTAALGGAPAVALGAASSVALGAASSLAFRMLAPALGAVVLVALVMGLAQTRGLILAPVRVDLGRLASAGSWRRLFDGNAALACGQGLLKVALVAAVAWLALRPVLGAVVGLPGTAAPRLLQVLGTTTERLAVRLAAAALVLGVADALLLARRHRKTLRMTRDEVKREFKESEGDPAHRGERQRLHREIAEQRMVDEVRKADFVVVNPDHIAVALRYDADGAAAPVVVAKGERLVAERIKQVAREAGVPIFRDVGLARSLAELAEGGEIPAELYEAVAEILRVVQGLDAPAGAPADPGGGLAGAPADPGGAMERAAAPASTLGRGAEWKRV